MEIRATGLDNPSDVEVAGAVAPLLSATTPDPANPEWDDVARLGKALTHVRRELVRLAEETA